MATTQASRAAKAPLSRPCPHCTEALTTFPCGNCGWQPGLVPVALARTPDGPVTTFVAERRHRLMLIFGALSCLTGVIILIAGISHGAVGSIVAGLLFGPVIFAAGVVTLKNTRGGKAWWGLSAKEKGLAIPGLICGGFIGLLIIPAVLFGLMVMKISAEAWS
jgi:hypothetical protein